tara:strand:+ start:394 stop:555 length:162 start_codon:yes stop_codon:yes gene_type:complete
MTYQKIARLVDSIDTLETYLKAQYSDYNITTQEYNNNQIKRAKQEIFDLLQEK